MLLNPKMKYEYLKRKFNLVFPKGESEFRFKVSCEFCQKEISGRAKLFGTGNPEQTSLSSGMFHHKDGDPHNNSHDNIQVLCYQCRKHFQYWGIVQRYLKKINRKPESLPDCSKVPPVYSGRDNVLSRL